MQCFDCGNGHLHQAVSLKCKPCSQKNSVEHQAATSLTGRSTTQFIAVKITRSPSTTIIFQITQFFIFSYKTAIFQIHGNQSPKCCTTEKQLQFAASALSCVDPFTLHSNRFLFSSGLEGGLIIPKPQRLQKQRREKQVPCMSSRKLGKHPAAGWHNDWTP